MKRLAIALIALGFALLTTGVTASANPGHSGHSGPGDSNAGDIFVDNVGEPSGPGHEMDPHLACTDINLYGDKLADSSGTYTIDGWHPSGSGAGDVAYSATWSYDTGAGGVQVISVINVNTLIAAAAANGDQPQAQQGYHFKIQFSQDPQKHKTFWVNCPTATPVPTATPTATPLPTATAQPTATADVSPTATATPTPAVGVQGITTTLGGNEGTGAATPATGTPLPLIGLLLAGIGLVLLGASRRLRRN